MNDEFITLIVNFVEEILEISPLNEPASYSISSMSQKSRIIESLIVLSKSV